MNLTTETENHDHQDPEFSAAVVRRRRGFSMIWLLPLIALSVGSWLIYKNITEKGIPIEIAFNTAEGLEEDKTKVIYKGIQVGKVDKITLNSDFQGVTAHITLLPGSEEGLKDNTLFWLVKPRVSLAGVTGLETLVTGNYIAARPGDGEPKRKFIALGKPPPLDISAPGLHIKLKAKSLGSVGEGTTVYFRQIPVGDVQSHHLSGDRQSVIMDVHIEEKYASLVKKTTRFWNASGVSISGGLSGIKVRTESLTALLTGGIAFYTPLSDEGAVAAENGDHFEIYNDFTSAEAGIEVKIHFAHSSGLVEGETRVKVEGFEAGVVEKIEFDEPLKRVTATVKFDPRAETLLRERTKFWLVKPDISITGISGLDAIIEGNYIDVLPGKGKPIREFNALVTPPPLTTDTPGLHLALRSKDLGGLERGSPVFYRKIPVGDVQGYHVAEDGKHVMIKLHIKEQYAQFVKFNSRFWNASGITVSGGLNGLRVKTESLASIAAGGVGFFTPATQKKYRNARNGDIFELYDDYASATEFGSLDFVSKKTGVYIKIKTSELGSIGVGTPIYYQRLPVGRVERFNLAPNKHDIIILAHIQRKYTHLVTDDSHFWRTHAIDVSAGLSGIDLRIESLKSLVSGGIAFYNPKPGGKVPRPKEGNIYILFKDADSARDNGIPIEIHFTTGKGLTKGSLIKYRGITIGKANDIILSKDGRGIIVKANIERYARHLVRKHSLFWIVGPSLGLANSANLDTLITGRYIELRPGHGKYTETFTGLEAPPHDLKMTRGLNLILVSDGLGSVRPGNTVYYRQIPVGRVTGYELGQTSHNVLIHINIEKRYAPLVRKHTQFWNASGIEASFGIFSGINVKTESMTALLQGGIAFATPENAEMGPPARDNSAFTLQETPEDYWLSWSPRIILDEAPDADVKAQELTSVPLQLID